MNEDAIKQSVVENAEPPRGIQWARESLNKYERQITGEGANILLVYERDCIEAAAYLYLDDPVEFNGLRNKFKSRGVRISDWTDRVKKRATEIERERKQEVKAASKAQAAQAPQAATWVPLTSSQQQPVDGRILFRDIVAAITQRIHIKLWQAKVLALWVLFTWVFEFIAETNPIMRVVSLVENCGKSTLADDVLCSMVRSGDALMGITKSAFRRTLQVSRNTFFLDEADSLLKGDEEWRNLLNAVHRKGGKWRISEPTPGKSWAPLDIDVFVPMLVASIKKLPGMRTMESRSIHIWMERATGEDRSKLLQVRPSRIASELAPIKDRCSRWAIDSAPQLAGRNPQLSLGDGRDIDKWVHLIAIADFIDPLLGLEMRDTALRMINERDPEDDSFSILILDDIHALFDQRVRDLPGDSDADRYPSGLLCNGLQAMDDRPWHALPRGKGREPKPLTERDLSRLLKGFKTAEGNQIGPKLLWIAGKPQRGYERRDFADAWSRYTVNVRQNQDASPANNDQKDSFFPATPPNGDFAPYDVRPQRGVGESAFLPSVRPALPNGSEKARNPYGQKGSNGLTDKNAEVGDSEKNNSSASPSSPSSPPQAELAPEDDGSETVIEPPPGENGASAQAEPLESEPDDIISQLRARVRALPDPLTDDDGESKK
jgi:hypothetical protein